MHQLRLEEAVWHVRTSLRDRLMAPMAAGQDTLMCADCHDPIPRRPRTNVFGLTHVGLKRDANTDHFLLGAVRKHLDVRLTSIPGLDRQTLAEERLAFVAMVADGVGGGERGGAASQIAVETLSRYISSLTETYYSGDPGSEAFIEALQNAASRAHDTVQRKAEEDRDLRGMATTLTVFLGVWPWAYLLQVGDSRHYLYREGKLTQITRDQTMAQELVDQGVFTRADAAYERWAHVLSSSIGGKQTAPVVTRIKSDWRNIHLLCSDGLTKHVSDDKIALRLSTMTSAQQACETLLQDALDDGGSDNVTIIVGRAVVR
jgi:protein phosphatase